MLKTQSHRYCSVFILTALLVSTVSWTQTVGSNGPAEAAIVSIGSRNASNLDFDADWTLLDASEATVPTPTPTPAPTTPTTAVGNLTELQPYGFTDQSRTWPNFFSTLKTNSLWGATEVGTDYRDRQGFWEFNSGSREITDENRYNQFAKPYAFTQGAVFQAGADLRSGPSGSRVDAAKRNPRNSQNVIGLLNRVVLQQSSGAMDRLVAVGGWFTDVQALDYRVSGDGKIPVELTRGGGVITPADVTVAKYEISKMWHAMNTQGTET